MSIDVAIGSGGGDLMGAAIGFGGAVVGGLFTLAGVMMQQRGETKRRRDDEAETLTATLKALDTEMETLWASYLRNVGNKVAEIEADHYLDHGWEAATDYFVVYRAAGPMLGRIRDDQLRRSIVIAYTTAMGLLETHREYRGMTNRAWQAELDPDRHRVIMPNAWHQVEHAFPLLQAQQAEVGAAIADMHAQIRRVIKR